MVDLQSSAKPLMIRCLEPVWLKFAPMVRSCRMLNIWRWSSKNAVEELPGTDIEKLPCGKGAGDQSWGAAQRRRVPRWVMPRVVQLDDCTAVSPAAGHVYLFSTRIPNWVPHKLENFIEFLKYGLQTGKSNSLLGNPERFNLKSEPLCRKENPASYSL